MLNRISISLHPIELLIQQLDTILPGIEKAKAYYFDEQDFKLKLIEKYAEKITPIEIGENQLFEIQKNRGISQKYEWYKEDNPLFTTENSNFQLSISDHKSQNLLCLRFENPVDHLYDIIFIYFGGKTGVIKLTSDSNSIKSDEKNIIERILYNNFNFILNNERKNKKLYQNVLNHIEILKNTNIQLKNDVVEKSESYKKSIAYFCKSFVSEIAKYEKLSITITQNAIDKIISENITFDKLENILSSSIEVCINKTLDINEHLIIDEYDLIIQVKPAINAQKEEVIHDRYAKTKEYLDRYEKAAETVLSKGLNLTGIHLGNHCSPKITPAAISDNIKKHRSKIITLLNRYQEKWPIIRENYRPISKLIDHLPINNSFKEAV